MLSKSFKAGKCKTSLKLAAARIKLLRNKREVQVKSMRRELAQLLESGQEQTARIRVEHVIREEKTMAAYDLIELYCELIAARLPIIESQKACPIDLKEAISSVIFASPRCADIPELIDIRKHLSAKYGKEFVNSVLEVRPDCGVSRLVVEKLSARAPDVETKIKILTSIAQEYKVKWDSKSFEEQLQKPNDDLLNGPTFSSSNKVPKESSSVNYPPAADHSKESSTSKNAASKPTSVGTSSYTNSRTSSTSEPFRSQPELRAPAESSTGGGEVKNSYSREENISSNRSTWNIEFKDAASAAQAAAESAERASMAARAAAEFATRENVSRQNSSGSNEPSTYSVKNERPDDMPRASKLKGEDVVEDSLPKAYGEPRKSQGMKPEIQKFQRDVTQGVFQREAGETVVDYSRAQKEASHFSSLSSQINVDDGFLNISSNVTSVKNYDHSPKMPPASESMEHDHKNVEHEDSEYGREHVVNYGESAFSNHASNFDDESSRYPRYGNNVVFDDYGCDADDIDVFGSSNRVKSPFSHQREESSVHQSTADHASPKQHTSWSPSRNKNPKLHLFTESERYHEKITPVSLSSQSDENFPATFDDSDGLDSESEEEKDDHTNKNAIRPGNVLHNERSSGRDLFHEESGHGLENTFFDERKELANIGNKSASSRNSGGNNEEHEGKPYAADIFWKKISSSSSLDNQSSSRIDKAPSNSYDLRRGLDDSSSDEDAQPLHSSNVQSKRKSGTNEQLASLPLGINDPEILDKSSDESEQGLNYGRLTGGFKHRGFPRPPYVRNSAVDDSYTSKQNTSETYSISKKPTVSKVEKLSAGMEVLDKEELVDQELLPKAKVHISRISEASNDSHPMLYDENISATVHKKSSPRPMTSADSDDRRAKLDSDFTAENKANVDVKLSRRTRGMPSEAKNSALRFVGRPDVESKSSHTNSIAYGSHTAAVHDVVNIHGKDNSKTSQQNLPTEQPTLVRKQKSSAREESPKSSQQSSTERVVPANTEKTKSPHSSGGSSSRENSLKNPAHTHPKLPDYDSLAAHFQSLRSNRN
ncbi:uncharacterized protein M6B38_146335 [Iris pallida]|uniref:IST1-like protein n=1 Tax=Iris pallida TaxID=29817 RepID=A0AAX6F9Q2_IRIPA|nr:uncharacterized protein M6B38_146335 [Iris pallida]